MSVIVSKKQKKVYVFDILASLVLITMIVYVVFLVVSPVSDVYKRNDSLRRTHLTQMQNALRDYTQQSGTGFLSEITNCIDGWTTIGKSKNSFNLENLIGESVNSEDGFIHDPKIVSEDTGYEICKSIDNSRIQFNAPNADLRDNITSGISIDE
jgi:hypothetical protein